MIGDRKQIRPFSTHTSQCTDFTRFGRFRLEPHVADQDEFYLLPNGSLVAPYLFESPLGPDEFCMDVFPDTDNGDVVVLPLVCFPPPEGPKRSGLQFILYPIGNSCFKITLRRQIGVSSKFRIKSLIQCLF